MKILVLSMAPYDFATRSRKAARAYSLAGADVAFVAPQSVGRTGKRTSDGVKSADGIVVHHMKARIPRPRGDFATKVWNLTSVYLPVLVRLLRVVLTTRSEVVHVNGAPLLVLGVLHRLRFGSRLIVDINERPASVTNKSSLFAMFSRLEPWVLRVTARVAEFALVVSPGHNTLLSEFGFDAVVVVRNAPERAWLASYVDPPARVEHELRLVIVGTLFEGRGLESLVAACNQTKSKGIRVQLDIFGSGSVRYTRELRAAIAAVGVEDMVHLHGPVPKSEVSARYLDGHVGLALYDPADPGSDSLSNKIIECVASGRPVIAGALPENIRFMQDASVGWLSDITVQSLTDTLCEVAAEEDLGAIARRCRRLGETSLNWESEFGIVLARVLGDVRPNVEA